MSVQVITNMVIHLYLYTNDRKSIFVKQNTKCQNEQVELCVWLILSAVFLACIGIY